jgi:hypothetical protein
MKKYYSIPDPDHIQTILVAQFRDFISQRERGNLPEKSPQKHPILQDHIMEGLKGRAKLKEK